jgi:hypothetical protein
VPQSYYFCITYDCLYFKKILSSLSLAMKGRHNKGRRGEERRGKEVGKRRGNEGKRERSRGYSPQIWNSVLAPG